MSGYKQGPSDFFSAVGDFGADAGQARSSVANWWENRFSALGRSSAVRNIVSESAKRRSFERPKATASSPTGPTVKPKTGSFFPGDLFPDYATEQYGPGSYRVTDKDTRVYMGEHGVAPKDGKVRFAPTAKVMTERAAADFIYGGGDERMTKLMEWAGTDDLGKLESMWADAVRRAQASFRLTDAGKNGDAKTPFEFLREMGRKNTSMAAPGSAGGPSQRTTTRTIDEPTEGQLWGHLQSAAEQLLGRAPTDSELRRFAARASDIAARNPTVSTTSEKVSADGGSVTRTATQSGGVTEADYELEARKAAATPEAAAFQVASTYMNALERALEGGMSL